MTRDDKVKEGSEIRYKGKNWLVTDFCPPCQKIGFYRVEFVPYKSKKGNKPVVKFGWAHYHSVQFLAT